MRQIPSSRDIYLNTVPSRPTKLRHATQRYEISNLYPDSGSRSLKVLILIFIFILSVSDETYLYGIADSFISSRLAACQDWLIAYALETVSEILCSVHAAHGGNPACELEIPRGGLCANKFSIAFHVGILTQILSYDDQKQNSQNFQDLTSFIGRSVGWNRQ